ncbi:MAG: hypothetical protein ACXVGN_03785 [Mycobacteriaceae bacterium]
MIVSGIVLALLGVITVLPTATIHLSRRSWAQPGAQVLMLAAAGVLAPLPHALTGFPRASAITLGVLAAAGGASPVVRAVFRLAGRTQDDGQAAAPAPEQGPAPEPQNVLRGGGVIGVLERASVAASILAYWPAGIAIVLAVKGLARYPELRDSKVSEQFIIGTFTSVLWAAGCSGVVVALIR